MIDLDHQSSYAEPHVAQMFSHLHGFPEQCRLAWEKAVRLPLPAEYQDVDKVLILGMGASAIGGEVVRILALDEGRVPISIHQDYGLPAFVDEKTLVIASSFSGNTEETLSSFTKALGTLARKLAITSGGRLGRLAASQGIPVFTIESQAPPRASFPHSFIPLLHVLQTAGLMPDRTAHLHQALRALDRQSQALVETMPLATNPAKQLATRLAGRFAVICGAEMLAPVARRWKTQLNENSKVPASYELLPDLVHNAIEGFRSSQSLSVGMFVVLLSSDLLRPRVLLQYEATAGLLAGGGVEHETVLAAGETPLAQVLSTVLLGDYVSLYLATLNGADPMRVDAIDHIKSRLAENSLTERTGGVARVTE